MGSFSEKADHTSGQYMSNCMPFVNFVLTLAFIFDVGVLENVSGGTQKSLGQEYPLYEVGTPPPRDLGKVYWPVANNIHTFINDEEARVIADIEDYV